jgi:lipopolysaccharide biosynthesis regulator YciM
LKLYPKLDILDLLYDRVAQTDGLDAAKTLLRELVHAQPTLKGSYRLIESQIFDIYTPETRADAELIRGLVLKYAQKLGAHRCYRCSFKSTTFFWHCPACGEWESLSPNLIES